MQPPDTIQPGKFQRFPGLDKNHGNDAGWCMLFGDGRGGVFGDFSTGLDECWQTETAQTLSAEERQAFKKRIEAERQKRQAEEAAKHSLAANKAVYTFQQLPPAPANHPYLVKKRIQPHGARLGRDNTLVIPLHNHLGELVNLQFISETGQKRFLSGGLKKGCFHSLGDPTQTVLICEGFATGASLLEDCGFLTVVAFDAGNLKEVAKVIRQLYPDSEIVICADNDASGIGEKKAREAALVINCKYILPPALSDFNDMLSGGAL